MTASIVSKTTDADINTDTVIQTILTTAAEETTHCFFTTETTTMITDTMIVDTMTADAIIADSTIAWTIDEIITMTM